MVFGQKLKVLTSGENDTRQKHICRGVDWCKCQLRRSFQRVVKKTTQKTTSFSTRIPDYIVHGFQPEADERKRFPFRSELMVSAAGFINQPGQPPPHPPPLPSLFEIQVYVALFLFRSVLVTASEDNTVRIWGHANKPKRENGMLMLDIQCDPTGNCVQVSKHVNVMLSVYTRIIVYCLYQTR